MPIQLTTIEQRHESYKSTLAAMMQDSTYKEHGFFGTGICYFLPAEIAISDLPEIMKHKPVTASATNYWWDVNDTVYAQRRINIVKQAMQDTAPKQ